MYSKTVLCIAALLMIVVVEAQPPASRPGYVETPLGPRIARTPLSDTDQSLATVQYLNELKNAKEALSRDENDVSLGALLNAYDARRGVSGKPGETPEQFHQRIRNPYVQPNGRRAGSQPAQPPAKQGPTLNELLYSASNALDLNQIQDLIRQGANVNHQQPRSDKTVLHRLAELYFKDPRQVKDAMLMLWGAGANVNVLDHNGDTPLYLASLYKNKAAAEFLMAHSADPQIPNKWDETPLSMTQDPQHPLHALLRGSTQLSEPSQSMQEMQIQQVRNSPTGSRPSDAHQPSRPPVGFNGPSSAYPTEPFMHAGSSQQSQPAQHQVRQPPSLEDNLDFCCKCVAVEDISKLIQQGVDVNYRNPWKGDTGLHLLAGNTNHPANDVVIAMYLLLDAGANVNVRNIRGDTPLDVASRQNNHAAIEVLLANGGLPSSQIKDTRSQLSSMTNPFNGLMNN